MAVDSGARYRTAHPPLSCAAGLCRIRCRFRIRRKSVRHPELWSALSSGRLQRHSWRI